MFLGDPPRSPLEHEGQAECPVGDEPGVGSETGHSLDDSMQHGRYNFTHACDDSGSGQ